jgi:hypothetical protein
VAQYIYTNCSLVFAAPIGDVSALVKSVTINFNPDMLDNTAMSMTGKSRKKGLADWSFDVELINDYTDEGIDEDFWTVAFAGTPILVTWRPDAGIIGVGNPSYSGTGIIEGVPFGGAVGDLATLKFKVVAAGTTLTRATA